MCGENGVDLGSALGPCTVQLSFRPETPGFADVWISRYAEPEAEGVMPVTRTKKHELILLYLRKYYKATWGLT